MFGHPFPTLSPHVRILRRFIVGQIFTISQAENYLRRRCEKWVKRESNRRIRIFAVLQQWHRKREEFGMASLGQRTGSGLQWFSRFNYEHLFRLKPDESSDRRKCIRRFPSRWPCCSRQIKRAVKLQWSESGLIMFGSLVRKSGTILPRTLSLIKFGRMMSKHQDPSNIVFL